MRRHPRASHVDEALDISFEDGRQEVQHVGRAADRFRFQPGTRLVLGDDQLCPLRPLVLIFGRLHQRADVAVPNVEDVFGGRHVHSEGLREVQSLRGVGKADLAEEVLGVGNAELVEQAPRSSRPAVSRNGPTSFLRKLMLSTSTPISSDVSDCSRMMFEGRGPRWCTPSPAAPDGVRLRHPCSGSRTASSTHPRRAGRGPRAATTARRRTSSSVALALDEPAVEIEPRFERRVVSTPSVDSAPGRVGRRRR